MLSIAEVVFDGDGEVVGRHVEVEMAMWQDV